MNRYFRRRIRRPILPFTDTWTSLSGMIFPTYAGRAWYCHPTKGWRSFIPA